MPYIFLFNPYDSLVVDYFHFSGVKTEVTQLIYIKAGIWRLEDLDSVPYLFT